jgi:GAF domain-containing protein
VARSRGAFSEKEMALLQTFADQAVIAIQNARMFEEVQAKTRDLTEALQQQTATAEVLKVISRSAFDLDVAASAILAAAAGLCRAPFATLHLRDGDVCRLATQFGLPEAFEHETRVNPIPVKYPLHSRRPARAGEVAHFSDAWSDPDYLYKSSARIGGYRALLVVPLMRNGELVGIFSLGRPEPDRFTESQIKLTQTFADQAAIAIENARLFEEVQARTRDLSEALQQQTATAEVLKVISRSAFDLDAVLNSLTKSAIELCNATYGVISLYRDGVLKFMAQTGCTPEFAELLWNNPASLDRKSVTGRTGLLRAVVLVPDVKKDKEYNYHGGETIGNYRSMMGVPLLRNGELEGVFTLMRREPGTFTTRQVELVETFADQAVIAIENVRLFDEVQARTRDLSEALQLQTATSDVLKVISRSAFDLQTVFNTLVSSAVELGGALTGTICVRDGEVFRYRDTIGAEHTSALAQYLRDHPPTPGRSTIAGRVLLSGKVERIPDCLADPEYVVPMGSLARNIRSLLGVPLLRKDGVEGAIILTRAEPGDFSDRQVEIVQTFADQAVIALENVRLFDEVQARTKELAASLNDLNKAQDRLIQSEKLASLGQLTAGIAHEIKNPLNFINNFSALSRELMDELRGVFEKASLEEADRNEAGDLIEMIDSNLEKVVSHGKRADSIVKNMLLHSREGSGERTHVDINSMVEEALNLAYHGARAEKPGFSVAIVKSLDEAAGGASIYAQEMTRVLLNLISNGFYATAKRKHAEGNSIYEPAVTASTRNLGNSVEIAIRDNGTGIPDAVKAKIFNPFFTTKPAGEGTGLGLSLSHDIVVKQHGGTLDVETAPGAFTEFVITLPRVGAGT